MTEENREVILFWSKTFFIIFLMCPFTIPFIIEWWDRRKKFKYELAKSRAFTSHHWEDSEPCMFCGIRERDFKNKIDFTHPKNLMCMTLGKRQGDKNGLTSYSTF